MAFWNKKKSDSDSSDAAAPTESQDAQAGAKASGGLLGKFKSGSAKQVH